MDGLREQSGTDGTAFTRTARQFSAWRYLYVPLRCGLKDLTDHRVHKILPHGKGGWHAQDVLDEVFLIEMAKISV